GRSRVAPGLRPPTDGAGLAYPATMLTRGVAVWSDKGSSLEAVEKGLGYGGSHRDRRQAVPRGAGAGHLDRETARRDGLLHRVPVGVARDRRIPPRTPAGDAVQAGSQRGARLRRHPVREGGRLRPVRAARRLTLREHRPRARVTAGGPPPGPRGWVCSSTRSIFSSRAAM